VSLSSAHSITAAVRPPRAVFTDFPLGRTAGKPRDVGLQRRIMLDALRAVVDISTPGAIVTLPYRWSDDDSWKTTAMAPRSGDANDDRLSRDTEPQYQYPQDREAAERRLRGDQRPGGVQPPKSSSRMLSGSTPRSSSICRTAATMGGGPQR
jgi:hypothetical protein